VTLTDVLGRRVTITNRPQRIVSLSPSATEDLFDIGAGSRIVGVTTVDNYPPQATRLPRVGDFFNPSTEKILSLRPDLVVAARGNPKDLPDSLGRLGLAVYTTDPASVKDISSVLRSLGKLTGQVTEADSVAARLESRIEAVQRAVQTEGGAPTSGILEIWYDRGVTIAGPHTFLSDVMRIAGCKNLAPANGPDYGSLSTESLLELKPQCIFLADGSIPINDIRKRPGWSRIPAVQQSRVFPVPMDIINRPTPRIVEALTLMADDLHPGLLNHAQSGHH
jgi:iron complex transport system substrate-binding protein